MRADSRNTKPAGGGDQPKALALILVAAVAFELAVGLLLWPVADALTPPGHPLPALAWRSFSVFGRWLELLVYESLIAGTVLAVASGVSFRKDHKWAAAGFGLAALSLLIPGLPLAAGLASAEMREREVNWRPWCCYSATLLRDGRVLVAGGVAVQSTTSASMLYDPVSARWTEAAPMNFAHSDHHAALLRDGRVLVVDAYAGPPELFDPVRGSWSLAAVPQALRYVQQVLLTPDGSVLAIGREGPVSESPRDRANPPPMLGERYDPQTGTWTPIAPLARLDASVVALQDGTLVAAGGVSPGDCVPLTSVERYDPGREAWVPAASMTTGRHRPLATVLQDGRVLVLGGDPPGSHSAELYNPVTDEWIATGSPGLEERDVFTAQRAPGVDCVEPSKVPASLVTLRDGRALLYISPWYQENYRLTNPNLQWLYDPTNGSWSEATPTSDDAKIWGQSMWGVVLADGRVLVTRRAAEAHFYDPTTDAWSATVKFPRRGWLTPWSREGET